MVTYCSSFGLASFAEDAAVVVACVDTAAVEGVGHIAAFADEVADDVDALVVVVVVVVAAAATAVVAFAADVAAADVG